MNIHNVPAAATRDAMLFSIVSRSAKLVPPFDRWLVGENTVPKGWVRSAQHADEIGPPPQSDQLPGTWIRFAGDPEGPALPRPRKYKVVGMVALAQESMARLSDVYPDGQEAVAVAFRGAAVAVGALAENRRFALDPEQPNDRLLAVARIGRGALQIAAGLWIPNERQFIGVQIEPVARGPIGAVSAGVPIA